MFGNQTGASGVAKCVGSGSSGVFPVRHYGHPLCRIRFCPVQQHAGCYGQRERTLLLYAVRNHSLLFGHIRLGQSSKRLCLLDAKSPDRPFNVRHIRSNSGKDEQVGSSV